MAEDAVKSDRRGSCAMITMFCDTRDFDAATISYLSPGHHWLSRCEGN